MDVTIFTYLYKTTIFETRIIIINMKWITKTYNELSKEELYSLLRLRAEVFVVEQDCPYQDVDNKDQRAIHIFASNNGEVIAYSRVFKAGDYFKETAIGRVTIKQSFRGTGLGIKLMEKSIDYIDTHFSTNAIHISAQTYLKKYYQSLGFKQVGEGYLEDDIPHIGMRRN